MTASPVRRPWLRTVSAAFCVLLAAAVAACGSPTSSVRPSASLIDLEFTPRPTLAPSASAGTPTAEPTQASWPVGWDVSFCTALTDATVAHELVIDIERALDDEARDDARLLTGELTQIAPIAAGEVDRIRDWEPASQVKADLVAITALHQEVASAYQAWFDAGGGRSLLRAARRARSEVGRAVPAANENLQALADLGLGCPGVRLELESF